MAVEGRLGENLSRIVTQTARTFDRTRNQNGRNEKRPAKRAPEATNPRAVASIGTDRRTTDRLDLPHGGSGGEQYRQKWIRHEPPAATGLQELLE